MSRLWFECQPRPFAVPEGLACHRETFGLLDILEYRTESELLPYGLRMEAEVAFRNEVSPRRMEAIKIAGELNRIWAYVGGVPLFPKTLIISPIKSPVGWNSNSTELESSLPISGGFGEITFSKQRGQYLVTLDFMPLSKALLAVRAYRAADAATQILIKLHYDAMQNPGAESSLMLIAKDLELVRAMLPGKNDSQKQKSLQLETQRRLRRSLHWLFAVANERLEARHIVREPRKLELHTKLTIEERKDFHHDAELIIRDVVSPRLGLDIEYDDSEGAAPEK